ncbi:MAG: HD domain-containing protein [Nanoarchaeota archaeon]
MKEIFNEIKIKSDYMQDLRDDKGHAEIVTLFAKKLCEIFKANEDIVIPAAILHDIGYFGMDKNLISEMMAKKLSEEQEKKIKIDHMERGAKFAEQILSEINYEQKLIKEIVFIIRRHDLNDLCESIEEKIVRDADKLARFSKVGFYADIKRRKCTHFFWYEKLKKNFEKQNYFQTEEAKKIAIEELEKRLSDFSNNK